MFSSSFSKQPFWRDQLHNGGRERKGTMFSCIFFCLCQLITSLSMKASALLLLMSLDSSPIIPSMTKEIKSQHLLPLQKFMKILLTVNTFLVFTLNTLISGTINFPTSIYFVILPDTWHILIHWFFPTSKGNFFLHTWNIFVSLLSSPTPSSPHLGKDKQARGFTEAFLDWQDFSGLSSPSKWRKALCESKTCIYDHIRNVNNLHNQCLYIVLCHAKSVLLCQHAFFVRLWDIF